MFVASAVDWGNIADWVSGFGSLAAVLAALYIAGNERRSAERHRRIAENVEFGRRAKVIAEAIRLAAQIEALAGQYIQLSSPSDKQPLWRRVEVLKEIEGIRRQLSSLQQFPISDPRLFVEIGLTVHECHVDRDLDDIGTSNAILIMTRIAEQMAERRNGLAAVSKL
jgi:hypothetical protein